MTPDSYCTVVEVTSSLFLVSSNNEKALLTLLSLSIRICVVWQDWLLISGSQSVGCTGDSRNDERSGNIPVYSLWIFDWEMGSSCFPFHCRHYPDHPTYSGLDCSRSGPLHLGFSRFGRV